MIGRFPIARTVSGYENQILIVSHKGKECGSKESSRLWGGALRDEPKNGCEGDYCLEGLECLSALTPGLQITQDSGIQHKVNKCQDFSIPLLRTPDQLVTEVKKTKRSPKVS